MFADFYIARLSNDIKLVVQKIFCVVKFYTEKTASKGKILMYRNL